MKIRFPHTFTILFILIILIALLSYILPSGEFKRVYDQQHDREIVVADSYHTVDSNHQGIIDVFSSFSRGIIDAAEIISYVLIIGGAYGVIIKTNAIDTGLKRAIQVLKGREFILIPVIMLLCATAGASTGFWEETLALYLIIIPLMIAAGFDVLVGIATVLIGAITGCMASIVNPFATGIASSIAEISLTDGIFYRIVFFIGALVIAITYVLIYAYRVKKDPKKSIVYDLYNDHKQYFSHVNEKAYFTFRHKIIVVAFITMIVVMIYSLMQWGWWIPEITMLFLITSMFAAIISSMNQYEYWDAFVEGAKDLLFAALVIALARGIVLVAQDGKIIDTILYGISVMLSGLDKTTFIIINEFVQVVIAFFIPSSSGQAALTMPIMAPLADLFSIHRSTVVTAYQISSGLANMVTPTAGVLMAALAMGRITWKHWLKFVTPLLLIQFVFACCILLLSVLFPVI